MARLRSVRFINCDKSRQNEIEQAVADGRDVYIRTPHQFGDVDHYEIFKPTDEIENTAISVLNGADNVVGIHIRRTDNVKSIENSPTELFVSEMKKIVASDEAVKFFVATDSEQDKQELKKQFGKRIISQDHIDLSRNTSSGIISACVDLVCLSHCKEIIGSYWSSYSETAALWYGEKELKVLVKNQEEL